METKSVEIQTVYVWYRGFLIKTSDIWFRQPIVLLFILILLDYKVLFILPKWFKQRENFNIQAMQNGCVSRQKSISSFIINPNLSGVEIPKKNQTWYVLWKYMICIYQKEKFAYGYQEKLSRSICWKIILLHIFFDDDDISTI